jgi:hypothetical protein
MLDVIDGGVAFKNLVTRHDEYYWIVSASACLLIARGTRGMELIPLLTVECGSVDMLQ